MIKIFQKDFCHLKQKQAIGANSKKLRKTKLEKLKILRNLLWFNRKQNKIVSAVYTDEMKIQNLEVTLTTFLNQLAIFAKSTQVNVPVKNFRLEILI